MCVLGMRGTLGDAQRIGIELAAFLWNDKVDVVILGHNLRDVAIIFEHKVDFAGQEQVLAIILVECLHIGLLLDHQRFNGL